MVSVREIKRIFREIAPERQLPLDAIIEYQTRAEKILEDFAKMCDAEAGGTSTKTRLTVNHVKIAFVNFNDNTEKNEEEEELEFGEWNTDEGDELNG